MINPDASPKPDDNMSQILEKVPPPPCAWHLDGPTSACQRYNRPILNSTKAAPLHDGNQPIPAKVKLCMNQAPAVWHRLTLSHNWKGWRWVCHLQPQMVYTLKQHTHRIAMRLAKNAHATISIIEFEGEIVHHAQIDAAAKGQTILGVGHAQRLVSGTEKEGAG
jgi:hypothetical protein